MATIGKWIVRTAVIWALGKAWQVYQDKKARDRGYVPAK